MCFDKLSEYQIKRATERQKQVELAKKRERFILVNKIILIALGFLFISCEFGNEVYQATGAFINSKNIKIGTVEVIEQGTGSNFRIQLETLTPGFYAMHIHEKALCNTPDFTSAGGHHGLRSDGTFSGDFRPIQVLSLIHI